MNKNIVVGIMRSISRFVPLKFERRFFSSGISIVELLVAIAVIGSVLVSVFGFLSFSVANSVILSQTTQAETIAQSTLEASRNVRDGIPWNSDDPQDQYDGIGTLATDTPYHPQLSSASPYRWQILQGSDTQGAIFQRSLVFSGVNRDGNGNIVSSGGVSDQDTRKVTATVSWTYRGRPYQIVQTTYLTNWNQ